VAKPEGESAAPVTRQRRIYDAAQRDFVEAAEIARDALRPGMCADGPAVITERETTTIVTSAYRAIAQCDGSLLLIRKGAPA
jgi:N-methylhydantoinase A